MDETTMLGMTAQYELGQSISEYIRTPDGQLVAEETDHGTGYYLTDDLGNIVGLVTNAATFVKMEPAMPDASAAARRANGQRRTTWDCP